jgi:GNAT superfamily N-acetyltransferase
LSTNSHAVVSICFVERFPEPAFAELQREVFAPLESPSPEFAAAVRAEHSASGSVDPGRFPPMVRFGAFLDEQLVGWSYGWFERPDIFYMANSGVLPSHRRLGVYSQLVGAIVEHAQSHGAGTVHSRHSVLNTPVIIAKLKLGFVIAGTNLSEHLGLQVQLVRHASTARADVFHNRVIPFVRPHDA